MTIIYQTGIGLFRKLKKDQLLGISATLIRREVNLVEGSVAKYSGLLNLVG